MSVPPNFKTSKGTTLPILNFKGKPYLQVAHRIVWFREEKPEGFIRTKPLKVENDMTVFQAEVGVYTSSGQEIILGSGSKREDKAHFADHLEKAETGAIGRALAMAGYGTQFTADELDEGQRLADSPIMPAIKPKVVEAVKTTATVMMDTPNLSMSTTPVKVATEQPVVNKFKKPTKKETVNDSTQGQSGLIQAISNGSGATSPVAASDEGWS